MIWMRVLVFAAHKDDESIGMGGTIYKHAQRGDEVSVVFLTTGGASPGTMGLDADPAEVVEVRSKEARDACRVLGVKNIDFLDFKDQFLYLNEQTCSEVGKIIRRHRPDRIYVLHGDSAIDEIDNLDHTNTYKIVNRSVIMVMRAELLELGTEPWNTKEVFAYELPLVPMHAPTSYVDITDVMEKKLEALGKYESQVGWFGFEETVKGFNRWRWHMVWSGSQSKQGPVGYAEAFRAVRIFDIL